MPSESLELVLELARATDTGDPYAFRFMPQIYNLRKEDGTYADAQFPWSAEILSDLSALQRPNPDPVARQRLGEQLRTFLGAADWLAREQQIIAAVQSKRRVCLTIRSAAAELLALPWELVSLRATGEHLGELPEVLLRYEWPGTETMAPQPAPPSEGGRILFAWSAAGGAVPATEHLAALRDACTPGDYSFDEETDVVEHLSIARLRDALAVSARPVAVLHLLCHGGRLASNTEAYGLCWNSSDADAPVEMIDAGVLRKLLKPHLGTLRLVVLSACHGASSGAAGNALGGIAQALHRIGVPAVVASRQPLAVRAAILLAQVLYERLLLGLCSLEEAFVAARERIASDGTDADWAALQLFARAADGWDHRPLTFRPYRGLLAFQQEHARYFFGRQPEIEEGISDLGHLIADKKPRFLLVTGASGTGKSSLVFAGIVPTLQQRDGGKWAVVVLRPRDGLRKIETVCAAHADNSRPLLLIVDQFEEIFTDVEQESLRQEFVRRLWSLSCDPISGVSVLVTLRVDFLGRCSEISLEEGKLYLDGAAYSEAHRLFARRMTQQSLEEIIEQPAQRVGLSLEDGLAAQMIKDAGNEPGALPLVEYTLDQMWLKRSRQGERYRLDRRAYAELGGVTGALASRADAILDGFDELRRRAARRLLVQLVDTRQDATLDTRRRVRKDKLRPGPKEEAAVFDEVESVLVRERLLVLSESDAAHAARAGAATKTPIVELAHEQLVRSWDTLRGWLNEDRKKILELEPLRRWAEAAKGVKGYVLQGDQLVRARGLLAQYAHDLDADEKVLIERSNRAARLRRWGVITAGLLVSLAAVAMGALAIVARQQREAARVASLLSSIREQLARGDATLANRLLLEVPAPEKTRGFIELSHEVLAARVSKMVLRGEGARIRTAAFSPDGKRLLVVGRQGQVGEWLLDGSGRFIALEQNLGNVASAAFSVDNQRLVMASADNTVRVLEFPSLKKLSELKGHTAPVGAVALSHDGKRIVTASWDKTARVWELDGSGRFLELKGHTSYLLSAAFSQDDRRVVTSSDDLSTRVWELDGSGKFDTLSGHYWPVRSVAVGASGRVVTASGDNTARIWERDSTNKFRQLIGHTGPVEFAAFSPQDRYVVTASDDKTARIWDASNPSEPMVLSGHLDRVYFAAYSADAKFLITASDDATIRVWSLAPSDEPIVLNSRYYRVSSAAFSPDGKRVVTAAHIEHTKVWDLENRQQPLELVAKSKTCLSVAWSPDGRRIVNTYSDGIVQIFELENPSAPRILNGHTKAVNSVAWSPDGRRFVTASSDETVRVWKLASTDAPAILKGHTASVLSAAWSPDGKQIATASLDGTVRLWDANGAAEARVLRENLSIPSSAAWSPDSRRIVIANSDRTARIWEVGGSAAPKVLNVLVGHTGAVISAAFSPDGKRVVTASEDRTARVWELDGSERYFELKGHQRPLFTALFSPNGQRVVTAASDFTARVWTISVPALRERLDVATTECLQPEQRELYLSESKTEARVRSNACRHKYGR